jgi:hypothetical protein
MENPVNHRDLEGIVVNLVNTAVPRREPKSNRQENHQILILL